MLLATIHKEQNAARRVLAKLIIHVDKMYVLLTTIAQVRQNTVLWDNAFHKYALKAQNAQKLITVRVKHARLVLTVLNVIQLLMKFA
jgi:hypothetical protein